MSAATMETTDSHPTTAGRRNSASSRPASAAQRRSERELTRSVDAAELAVVELVNGSYDALRAFVPQAVLRPTQAVDYVFDIAEQTLGATRRACMELATIVEGGLQGTERGAIG